MAGSWDAVENNREYQSMTPEDQVVVKQRYYDTKIKVNPEFQGMSEEGRHKVTSRFFGIPNASLDQVAEAHSTDDDQSDQINIFSSAEIESMKNKGPIGWGEAWNRQALGDLIPFSPTGVYREGKVLNAVRKLKADEYNTSFDKEQDNQIVTEYLRKMQEAQVRGYSWKGKAIQMLSQLPGFMGEFMLTGGLATAGKTVAKKALKLTAKKGIKKLAGQTALLGAGAVARSTVMYNRYTPKYQERQILSNVSITDKGQAVFRESVEKPFISAAKSFGSTVIEVFSEETGAALTKGFKIITGAAGRKIPNKIAVEIAKAYRKFKPSGKVADLFTSSGYHGILEEMGEERIAGVMQAVTGIEVLPGDKVHIMDRLEQAVPSFQDLMLEAGVFAVPGIASIASQKAYNKLVKRGDKVSFEEVDKSMSQIEKEQIDDELRSESKEAFTEKELDRQIEIDDMLEGPKTTPEDAEVDVEVEKARVEALDPKDVEEAISDRRAFENKISKEDVIDKEEQKEIQEELKPVKSAIQKIEEKISSLEEKDEKVPHSLLKRREAALEALGIPKGAGRKRGVSAKNLIGIFEKSTTISEAKALRQLIKAEARSSEHTAKAVRREERAKLKSAFRNKAIEIGNIKNDVVKYIRATIPLRDSLNKEINNRGKLLSLVEKVNTREGLQKAFAKIDKDALDIERSNIIKNVKASTKKALKSGVIDVGYKQQIEDIVGVLDFTKISKKKFDKLKSVENFIKKRLNEGKEVTLPVGLIKTIDRLYRTPVVDMTLSELNLLQDSIDDLISIGKTKQLNREALMLLSQQRILRDLEEQGTRDITSVEQELPALGEKLNISSKFSNKFKKAVGFAQHLGEVVMPMDYFFDYLDNLQDYSGVLYNNFKKRVDLSFRGYLQQRDALSQEVIDYVKGNNLQNENLERVGIYAISKQDKGVAKLNNTGITSAQISAIKLTPAELGLYNVMRKNLDELAPQIADTLRKIYNKPFGKVKNYFSFMTDYDAMTQAELVKGYSETDMLLDMVSDKAEEFGQNQKNPNLKFAEKRTGAGKQKVKINALEVYIKHVDRATYAVNMSGTLKLLNSVNKSSKMQELIGDKGQEYISDWIKTVARNGVKGDIQLLDKMRSNLSAAQFMYRVIPTILQGTAILDGAAKIGTHAFRGMANVATSKKVRQFVLNNFTEVKDRIGGDAEFLEFGDTKTSAFRKNGFYAMRKLDGLTAASLGYGAYLQYINQNNIPLDFNNPNKDGIIYAERMVRLSQASAQAKDLPLALTSKQLTGSTSINRALFQFQTFLLNRWQLFRHEGVRYGIGKGEIGKLANVVFWLSVANYAEYGLRAVSNDLLNGVLGLEDKDEDENMGLDMLMTVLGNIPYVSAGVSVLGYGSTPIPTIDTMGKISKAAQRAVTSKTEQTKLRWAINFTKETLAIFKGVPKTFSVWANKLIEAYGD